MAVAPSIFKTPETIALTGGQTFYNAMSKADSGIEPLLVADRAKPFTVVDGATFIAAMAGFSSNDYSDAVKMFKGGADGVKQFVDEIAGIQVAPKDFSSDPRVKAEIAPLLVSANPSGLAAYSVGAFVAMVSGAGVRVSIDADNYYYNYGYITLDEAKANLAKNPTPAGQPTVSPADKVAMSGRSYMHTPIHEATDTAYIGSSGYLNNLGKYLKDGDGASFYAGLIGVLSNTDGGAYTKITSDTGKSVATEFLGIYTAELDRNLLTKAHYWMDDLLELTMVSAYGVAAGKIIKSGQLIDGNPQDYDYKNPTSNRSGIGFTKADRTALQAFICKYEWKKNPAIAGALAKAIGAKTGDELIHALAVYMRKASISNSDEVTQAAVAFLTQIKSDNAAITASIAAWNVPKKPTTGNETPTTKPTPSAPTHHKKPVSPRTTRTTTRSTGT